MQLLLYSRLPQEVEVLIAMQDFSCFPVKQVLLFLVGLFQKFPHFSRDLETNNRKKSLRGHHSPGFPYIRYTRFAETCSLHKIKLFLTGYIIDYNIIFLLIEQQVLETLHTSQQENCNRLNLDHYRPRNQNFTTCITTQCY